MTWLRLEGVVWVVRGGGRVIMRVEKEGKSEPVWGSQLDLIDRVDQCGVAGRTSSSSGHQTVVCRAPPSASHVSTEP